MWSSSFWALPWARVASFWLVFALCLVQAPLIAQSTTPEPRPQDGKPLSVTVSTASLLELWNSLADTKNKWKASQAESEALKAKLETGENKAAESSRLAEASEAESMNLLTSLEESLKREASLSQAAETRKKLDQEAIDQARGQQWVWGSVGLVIGGLTGLMIGLTL